jgi:uncharacterized protein YdiU (UPF0061 family)
MATSLENPIRLQHYRVLPPDMYEEVNPTPASQPQLLELNRGLLAEFGHDAAWYESEEALGVLSGNAVSAANAPIAMAYAGHQFGHWVPQLGDGRAHMLGQLLSADGVAWDVQLKGSGRTRFSRGGDGRATLGSVVREYVVSEAMAGLGIATSRSLAIVATGEPVMREAPEPGAILVRTAASHIRVGSFQYAAAHLGRPALQALADHVIERNYQELLEADSRYEALLAAVIARQARLVAQWMLVGFIHGVMNTDNMSVAGETIDFGPCAFIDEFKTNKVFSSIDRHGRYAWDQQAGVANWNLTQLAATLLPLLDEDEDSAVAIARAQLEQFTPQFNGWFMAGMRTKLGLSEATGDEAFEQFVRDTLQMLDEQSADFTLFFDSLTQIRHGQNEDALLAQLANRTAGERWLESWQSISRGNEEAPEIMRLANPAVIARNHRVEQVIEAANAGDLEPMRRLCKALATPYTLADENADLAIAPQPNERVTQTFCGT